MAWRMADSVMAGWLDNRVKGRVVGEIRLLGQDEPVRLELDGDACPDAAGCRIDFTNPRPRPGDRTTLAALQSGTAGDITCSRKCRVLDVSVEEALRLADAGQPVPEHLGNVLYLEWFSARDGRIVMETADFVVRVSERAWTMTAEEDSRRAEQVKIAMLDCLDGLGRARDANASDDPEIEESMDEFEAEAFLREGDQRSERFRIALEKYRDHPDRDHLVAREMGWNWIEDAQEADRRGHFDDQKSEPEDYPELVPNPLTEGRDWVRDKDGRPVHPLARRARDLAVAMWRECDALGLLDDDSPPDVMEFASQAQCMSAKLAGALNNLAYQHRMDCGMVIAWTKRSLPFLNGSLAAAQRAREQNLAPPGLLDPFLEELLAIRAEILALMQRYRDGG